MALSHRLCDAGPAMILSDDWTLVTALPLLAAAAGIAYASIVALGGQALRLRRREKKRIAQSESGASAEPPWTGWLREINAREARIRIDD